VTKKEGRCDDLIEYISYSERSLPLLLLSRKERCLRLQRFEVLPVSDCVFSNDQGPRFDERVMTAVTGIKIDARHGYDRLFLP